MAVDWAMNITRQQLIAACQRYGPLVRVPAAIDGTRLLWGLSGNESSFGQNCAPRHEAGYCPISSGRYSGMVHSLTNQWGCLAHMSFGCWQVMLVNCIGFSPLELLHDVDAQAQAVVGFLNRRIFDEQHASTLAEVGDAYNHGNFRDLVSRAEGLGISEGVLLTRPDEMAKIFAGGYMARLAKNYTVPMQ